MRLFICADIEGVAGVVTQEQTVPSGFEYPLARHWMTNEVVAACEGAKAAGVTEIVVADSHGSGQNLLLDELPEDVQVVRSWPRPLVMMQGIESQQFDACFLIGHHTGAHHSDGVLAHSFSSRCIAGITLNGVPASELTVNAALAGAFGTPVALVTGDDATCTHARDFLDQVVTVETKVAQGRLSARSLTPARSRSLIRVGAEAAIQRSRDLRPYRLENPISAEVIFKYHWNAELLAYLPMMARSGPTSVRFEARDIIEFSSILKVMIMYTPTPP